jgi:predicted transcriptional regulator YheO
MCIYDDNALPIGCICINQDITETLEVERALHNLNKYHGAGLSYDSTNISSVLDSLINDALAHQDVPPEQMDRAQRIEVIRYLDQHGAFLVTKAGERIANLLGISKYTLYSYLDTVRA